MYAGGKLGSFRSKRALISLLAKLGIKAAQLHNAMYAILRAQGGSYR